MFTNRIQQKTIVFDSKAIVLVNEMGKTRMETRFLHYRSVRAAPEVKRSRDSRVALANPAGLGNRSMTGRIHKPGSPERSQLIFTSES